jgi:hypothetical protein
MRRSKYDLNLRAWCIENNKPVPGKPETEYAVDWKANPFFNGIPKEYKTWGTNQQISVHVEDYATSEEYWQAVRAVAAKNLDRLSNK